MHRGRPGPRPHTGPIRVTHIAARAGMRTVRSRTAPSTDRGMPPADTMWILNLPGPARITRAIAVALTTSRFALSFTEWGPASESFRPGAPAELARLARVANEISPVPVTREMTPPL